MHPPKCPHDHDIQLFQRRIFIASFVPLLRRHVNMLERLGVAGMSSDESDTAEVLGNASIRNENTRYRVKRPRWRAPVLETWLRVFDTCYIVWRRTSTDAIHGAPVHLRERPSNSWSYSKKFVTCLEKNAYDAQWLHACTNVDVVLLPRDDQYDFTHDSRILE